MKIRITARRVSELNPVHSTVHYLGVVIYADMDEHDIIETIESIAATVPGDTWRKAMGKINNEENLI